MRAFIAIGLPDAFASEVVGLARELSASIEGRYVPRSNHHVTLAFLGDIGGSQAQDAVGCLEAAAASRGPVRLVPDGIGKFGRATDATLWLGLEETPELMALAEDLRDLLARNGIAHDEKPFLPHITLARRARIPKGELPPIAFPEAALANEMSLLRSELSRDGARYDGLHTVLLGDDGYDMGIG